MNIMYIFISLNYREVFHYSQKMFVVIHYAIIGGQPVHDVFTKLHDATIGEQPVRGAIAKI